jgi:outer membrane protein TolC
LRIDTWYRAAAIAIGVAAARPAWAVGQGADTVRATAADTAHATRAMVPASAAPDSGTSLGPRLPLDTVIALTMRYNPGLDSASGLVRTARSAQRVALGAYLPSVALNALVGRSDQSVASATGTAGGTVTSAVPQSTRGAGVSATLDLFTGGRRGAVRHQTAAASRAAEAGLLFQRYAAQLFAKEGYFEVLRGHELVRVGDIAVAVADTNLSYTKARRAAGTATPADVLQAELALSTARRQLLAAQDTLGSGAAALGRLVGADGLVDAEPIVLNPTALALSDSVIVEVAVRDAPAVRQAEAQVSATGAAVRAAKAQYAPTIFATGGYNQSNDGQVTGGLRQGWIVGVGASLPLFNGFVREDSVVRAKVSADEATSTAADTRRLSRSQALSLLGSLRVASQDVGLTIEAVRVATENLRVIASRYRVGIATILDLVTAQQNLIQAELDLVSARYTYQVTRATLAALLGREL